MSLAAYIGPSSSNSAVFTTVGFNAESIAAVPALIAIDTGSIYPLVTNCVAADTVAPINSFGKPSVFKTSERSLPPSPVARLSALSSPLVMSWSTALVAVGIMFVGKPISLNPDAKYGFKAPIANPSALISPGPMACKPRLVTVLPTTPRVSADTSSGNSPPIAGESTLLPSALSPPIAAPSSGLSGLVIAPVTALSTTLGA